MSLCEQYRPRTWQDLIGQSKARKVIDRLRPRGLAGRAYLLTGPTGVGKTSIAYLIAYELASRWYVEELDAGKLTIDKVAAWEDASHYGAPEPGGRCYVVNETHGLKPTVVRQLLVTLERIPSHAAWIFTTTKKPESEGKGQLRLFASQAEDALPFVSRCVELSLTSQGLAKPGAQRLLAIARAENLTDGQTDAELLHKAERLIHDSRGNLRLALQRIEQGALL